MWYAVIKDYDDNDWGTGSRSLEEALIMAKEMNAKAIVIVNDDGDPVAEDVILICDV